MAKITIKKAQTKAEKKAFMMLPFEIYKHSKYWVPPLLMDMRHMFDISTLADRALGVKGKHPFYEYGQMQLFMAYKNGKAVGRIAAINNPRYNKYHPEEGGTGFFGFFDSINDQEVANTLFDTARELSVLTMLPLISIRYLFGGKVKEIST